MSETGEKKNTLTILVVEDEAPLQEAIGIKLQASGFRYLPATNAEDALLILQKENPNLIWLDILMPGMTGLEFLQEMHKNPLWRNIPVMIVSVSASPEKIKQAFELNVVDYIVKSQYRLEEIIARVSNFFEDKPPRG